MTYGVFGTGAVGTAIATKLVHLGHDVMMGSRTAANDTAKAWATSVHGEGRIGTFAMAAAFGDVLFNCTRGGVGIDVLLSCEESDLTGKVLVDVSNPLDFSKGFVPTLTVCNDDSFGERLQARFPMLRVVKAFNTMNAQIMVEPSLLTEPHDFFMCGDNGAAKSTVASLAESFGWRPAHIVDLGEITSARGMEMVLPLWVQLYRSMQSAMFNFRIAR